MAGVIGRGDLVDGLTANSISTFGGNPLVSAGALANLDYLLDHDLQANAGPRAAASSTCWRRWPSSSTSSARCGAAA